MSELIENGAFASNLDGWTLHPHNGGGAITWDSGTLKIAQGGTSKYMHAYQAISTQIGRSYDYSVKRAAGDGNPDYAEFEIKSAGPPSEGSGQAGDLVSIPSMSNGEMFSGSFIATSAITYVVPEFIGSSNTWASFDDISVRPSENRAVINQMGARAGSIPAMIPIKS